MSGRKRRVLYLCVAVLAVGVAVIATRRTQGVTPAEEVPPLEASGVIQVKQIAVASEFGGRIAAIPVAEGETVGEGDVLVRLDTAMVDAQIESMRAMVEMAEAGLAQARAGVRPGQLAVAKAQLVQAETALQVARQAVSDTRQLVENPQDIELQIAILEAQLESAEHQLAQAVARKDAVELVKAQVDRAMEKFDGGGRYRFEAASGSVDELQETIRDLLPDLPPDVGDNLPDLPDVEGDYTVGDWEIHISDGEYTIYKWVNVSFPLDAVMLPNVWWQSWIGVNAAGAKKDGLEAKLANLYAQRDNPQMMMAKLDEARSMYAQLAAQVEMARIQVEAMEAGATPEQIAAIEAQVAQARAGLEALQKQREMLSLKAPISGTVMEIVMHPGEVAAAGATILTLANLGDMSLTVYVPENRLGQVYVGQPVIIRVNSYPGRTFEGRVARIADRAEFTPRNVATQEERVNLVFAVEIRVLNEEGLLKPGMPADVTFVLEPEP